VTDSSRIPDLTVDALERVVSALLRTEAEFSGGGLAVMGSGSFTQMLLQAVAVWSTRDPEGFGYAMQVIVREKTGADRPGGEDALLQLAAWMSEHALGRCTTCEGDRP